MISYPIDEGHVGEAMQVGLSAASHVKLKADWRRTIARESGIARESAGDSE
jgi:hypothetical protein